LTGASDKLIPHHNLLVACLLAILVAVVAVPRLARRFLVLPNRGVLAVGTLLFAIEALYTDVSRPLGYKSSTIWDSLWFAVFLFSIGYVSLQIVFASEHRLLSIENELAIAREIQTSILPSSSPETKKSANHHRLSANDGRSRRLL
jgi:hypothetical protein